MTDNDQADRRGFIASVSGGLLYLRKEIVIKHTPGPWKVVNAGPHYNNKATDNYQIQYGEDGECVSDHVYEPADAQLISAAPDLLAALVSLQNCIVARSTVEGDLSWTSDVVAAVESARDAISKAVAE